jgi:hypothetical protein
VVTLKVLPELSSLLDINIEIIAASFQRLNNFFFSFIRRSLDRLQLQSDL